MLLSLCADRTCYFTICNIRRTRERSTDALHVVEQSSVFVSKALQDGFRLSIQACELCTPAVSVSCRHQVPGVFSLHSAVALISGGNHDDRSLCLTATDNAWNVVVMQRAIVVII